VVEDEDEEAVAAEAKKPEGGEA